MEDLGFRLGLELTWKLVMGSFYKPNAVFNDSIFKMWFIDSSSQTMG
jgi:hypothetical protein